MNVKNIINNIELARNNIDTSRNIRSVVLVSGNDKNREYWSRRLALTSRYIFNKDENTNIFSFKEKTEKKKRQGNFLGTLLAYSKFIEEASSRGIEYEGEVVLVGMLFGRGERMSPFTQIEGNCKSAITASSSSGEQKGVITTVSEMEESLMYFTPVARYLEKGGFKGILNKWGDETEVASIDLSRDDYGKGAFKDHDIIKFVSTVKVTDAMASQKDWVAYDTDNNMQAQISRAPKEILINKLAEYGVKPDQKGDYYSGVSLGPVALSYDVLDIALEIFKGDIESEGVELDFDPYLLMAFTMQGDRTGWEETVASDDKLKKIAGEDGIMPDLFDKVSEVLSVFEEKYGRKLNIKIIDLGKDLFWSDIGQHDRMREKYLSLNSHDDFGKIARKLEGVADSRDEKGNIIIGSYISPDVSVNNSVIINSCIYGTGRIEDSVIKESLLKDMTMDKAFSVLSHRTGKTTLRENSGIYRSIGGQEEELDLVEGMRHGTLLLDDGTIGLKVSEKTDLKDKKNNYNKPVFDNKISFREAYDLMEGVTFEELLNRKLDLLRKIGTGE